VIALATSVTSPFSQSLSITQLAILLRSRLAEYSLGETREDTHQDYEDC
jgi:hypothetical protein